MRWLSALAGTAATAAALYVLAAVAPAPSAEGPTASVVSIVDEMAEWQGDESSVPAFYELPDSPKPSVSEVDHSISDVLAGAGYTEFVRTTELSQSLPPDVLELLIANEAVLVIPSEEE